MPLTAFQRRVAEILRPFRTERDYIAGGLALNQGWGRVSDDMDIFRDDANRLPDCVAPELDALRQAGITVEVTVESDVVVEAIVRSHGNETRIQWMDDPETRIRFFPVVGDDVLGVRLHQADNAVNKVLCAARRRNAPRDAVDLVTIVQRYAPLGPLIWATAGKAPDLAPLNVVQAIRGIAFGYSNEEIASVRMEPGSAISPDVVRSVLGPALDAAYTYCEDIAPVGFVGCLFVDRNEVPVAANESDIESGHATALRARDFGVAVVTDE